MKILLLTQWFDPEPTFKGLLFAKELVKRGHDVEVITGFPNYPGGRVYDGYKISLYQKEIIDGVTIHRVPLYPNHSGSAVKRILNYISFAISSSMYGIFILKKPDIIYAYHPPLTTGLSAVVISFLRRIPLVVDIQDLWPDTLAATKMLNNQRAISVVGWFCKFVYKCAAKIVVLSPGFKRCLVHRGVPEGKIKVIYNWCDEQALVKGADCNLKLPDNGGVNVLIAGNLGYAQGLPALIKAAVILKNRNVGANIVFLGSGVAQQEAEGQVQELGLENVLFLPRVPMGEVGSVLKQADVLLVHLIKDKLFSITIPSRTQAYLAVGKPIIMGVDGDAAELIKKARAGLVCEPNNAQALADSIERMAKMAGDEREVHARNSRDFYRDHLSVAIGVEQFISVFEEVGA